MSWTKLAATGLVLLGLVIVCMTHQVWAAAFLGVLFALSLNGPAEWLRQRVRMPAWVATGLVLLVVLATLTGLGWTIGPSLAGQADELTRTLPDATQNMVSWLERRPWGQRVIERAVDWSGISQDDLGEVRGTSDRASEPVSRPDEPQGQTESGSAAPGLGSILRPVFTALSLTAQTGALILVSLVVMLFVAFDPNVYRRGVLWLVPKRHEAIAGETMERLTVALRWWMVGRLGSMIAVAVITSLGMWMIGMPAPMALGALAGLLSFVPNIGPVVAAIPGLLLALGTGPLMAVWALGVYIVAQLIESNMITPLVDQYAVAVPPGVLIVTQFVFATLAGVWGMIVATPLMVVIIVLVQQLYIREGLDKPIEVTGTT